MTKFFLMIGLLQKHADQEGQNFSHGVQNLLEEEYKNQPNV